MARGTWCGKSCANRVDLHKYKFNSQLWQSWPKQRPRNARTLRGESTPAQLMRGRGIQHRHRTLEDVLRLPAALADRDEPDTAYLGDASQHVAQHAALRVRRVVE